MVYRQKENYVPKPNEFTLEYANQVYFAQKPKFEGLDYLTQILKVSKWYKKVDRDVDNSTENNWSVLSDLNSDGEGTESDEDFAKRLVELDQGKRLKRRSTMVSQFGFQIHPPHQKESRELQLSKPMNLKTKDAIINVNNKAILDKREAVLKDRNSKHRRADWHQLLKGGINKRKITSQNTRGEAFWFLNQLGNKLRHLKTKVVSFKVSPKKNEKSSLQNNIESSVSSEITSSNKSGSHPKSIAVPMSPIKRRKDIVSPTLNNEQRDFLKLCSIYKSEDFLSFNNNTSTNQRNNSATPLNRHELVYKEDEEENDGAKSCSKLQLHKRNVQNESITKSSDPAESPMGKNLINRVNSSNKVIRFDVPFSPENNAKRSRSPDKPKRKLKKRKCKKSKFATQKSFVKGKRWFWMELLDTIISSVYQLKESVNTIFTVFDLKETNLTIKSY